MSITGCPIAPSHDGSRCRRVVPAGSGGLPGTDARTGREHAPKLNRLRLNGQSHLVKFLLMSNQDMQKARYVVIQTTKSPDRALIAWHATTKV
ncbi:hypothetical protein BEI_2968 [Halomonas beimenensis]|uniref:Uncharacterized protein n=1 Tax=Halomonas beimenensis TaxID=475662 RepID=A0A291PAR4_9GAMM|nr:hypothetical protein BEI_2968 [Halomonas beimenensis]